MAEGADIPRPADFGITEEDLERTPCAFLTRHRAGVLAAVYLLVAAVLFLLILRSGGSYPAAALFTVLTVAAGSILLLPVVVLSLCATEQAEERWLCSRFPKMRACMAYRRALAEHARSPRELFGAVPESWWSTASAPSFTAAVRRLLERHFDAEVTALGREATGADFALQSPAGEVLVRCEPGSGAVPAGVGRELAAAVADRGATRAVIVTAAEPTPELSDYLAERPITAVAPWRLAGELGIRIEESPPLNTFGVDEEA